MSLTQKADSISRQRTWYFGVLAFILATHQGLFWRWDGQILGVEESVIWSLIAATVLFALATGGQVFLSRTLRDLIDDEVTRANRTKALSFGFVVTIVSAIGIFALSPVFEFTSQRAVHMIVSVGLIAALAIFIVEERKSLG